MNKIFIYGTLKQKQANGQVLRDRSNGVAEYCCDAVTVDKYPLVISTKYNIPGMLAAKGVGKNVIGEVWEMDDQMVAFLDAFERYPSFYDKVQIPVLHEKTGEEMTCLCYIIARFPQRLVDRNIFYDEYDNEGSHGLKFDAQAIADLDANTIDIYKEMEDGP